MGWVFSPLRIDSVGKGNGRMSLDLRVSVDAMPHTKFQRGMVIVTDLSSSVHQRFGPVFYRHTHDFVSHMRNVPAIAVQGVP